MSENLNFTQIGYVYVPTSNIDESIEWYTRNLSFRLQNKFKDRGSLIAVMHHPHEHSIALLLIETEDAHRLEISRNRDPFPIMALACPDIEKTHQQLKENGVDVGDLSVPAPELGDGTVGPEELEAAEAKYFYFRDNQGNLLEAAWSVWDPKDEIKNSFKK